jgi:hypothetical protein
MRKLPGGIIHISKVGVVLAVVALVASACSSLGLGENSHLKR